MLIALGTEAAVHGFRVRYVLATKLVNESEAPVVMFPPFHCLSFEHRLLTADLRCVPCGELRAGDRLLAFDEETPEGYTHRRLRWSEIVRSEPTLKECVRADRLLEKAPYVIRLTNTWEPVRTYESGWIAGMCDGEGSVYWTSRRRRQASRSGPARLPTSSRCG
ncbi:hypothetical protein SHJG_1383 [Streptomyces hygroscopicus subsp. jinggangensis 5008]|nr:hypothetical protein SHJG_1383 [Streptomyces hygroscopicus subsp. jinggangensis 5008]AGF60883.1 hypothetical protein SHJGH_1217 [Streptomyces hygroscopicus subsp. jinggangensis TL01]